MGNRAQDWLHQAEHNLQHAKDSRQLLTHDWACFAAQQAAEMACKALHLYCGQEAWGHVVADLMEELPDTVIPDTKLIDKARVLDNYYIPTRYPNGHPAGSPADHYGPLQSDEAIKYAGEIIEYCRSQMA